MNEDERSNDGDIEEEGMTMMVVRRPVRASCLKNHNLESILLNPIQATRTNNQGTVVTSTTRSGESVGITRIPSRASEEDVLREGAVVAEETEV